MTLQDFRAMSEEQYNEFIIKNSKVKYLGYKDRVIGSYKLRNKTIAMKVISFCKDNEIECTVKAVALTKSWYLEMKNKHQDCLEIRISNHTKAANHSRWDKDRIFFGEIKDTIIESLYDGHLSVDCGSLLMTESEIINLVKTYFA